MMEWKEKRILTFNSSAPFLSLSLLPSERSTSHRLHQRGELELIRGVTRTIYC